jgi:hypothetical protein
MPVGTGQAAKGGVEMTNDNRSSLAMQLGALKHCVAFAGQQGVSETIISAAEHGITSMTFLRDHRDAFVALMLVLQSFPDATIEGAQDDDTIGTGLGDQRATG